MMQRQSLTGVAGLAVTAWPNSAFRLCEKLAASRASVRLRNGADELVAPRVPSSRQEYGPTEIGGSLAGAIQEQELVFEEKRLSN